MGLGKLLTGAYFGRYDKTVHFIASAAIMAILTTFLPVAYAAALAFAVGVAKELYDWLWRKTRIEWGDLAVDALAIGVVVLLYRWFWPATALGQGVFTAWIIDR